MKRFLILLLPALLGSIVAAAQPKIVAHRGYWTAPGSAQNSLASFSKADSVGCFGSEIDVWLTADNHVVVFHDKVSHGLEIQKSKFADIRRTITLANGEKVPTLDEYLRHVATLPRMRLVLEMKQHDDILREDICIRKIVKALKKHGLVARTDFITFSINGCLTFKKLLPEVPIYYINGDLPPQSIKKLGFAGIDYGMKVYRQHPHWVKEAHDLGLEVNSWTVNSEEDMRFFIDLGLDYLTTNYPERLKAIIAEGRH